jgi:ubiquinone biosynthesis protein UbiJ
MPSRVFPRLDEWAEQLLDRMRPPVWLESEIKQRVLLFLNHVLMQESSALDRLRRQQGRQVQWRWRDLDLRVTITPAGLLERGDSTATPDLVLILNETSPVEVARTVLQGQRPALRIEGDVQLAADINWLVDHVRWDPEEDLARLIGDVPAHRLASAGRRTAEALRDFVLRRARASTAPNGMP